MTEDLHQATQTLTTADNLDFAGVNLDEDEGSDGATVIEIQGTLSKWTNYIHGWQTRFIVLKDGTLSYYKSAQDSDLGCRGSISLYKANIKVNE